MDKLQSNTQGLYLEQVSLKSIAREFGTPGYVYSRATIEERWQCLDKAFGQHPHCICYAVKAAPNIALLNLLALLGSGFEVVSGGELQRVIKAGGDVRKVMFSGVGKRRDEIEQALRAGIYCLNIESRAELMLIETLARQMGIIAPIALRVNPDINANTHDYITTGRDNNKFGIASTESVEIYQYIHASEALEGVGIGCHIGSQITDLVPLTQAAENIIALANQLVEMGLPVKHVNLGGGLGIRYFDDEVPTLETYVETLLEATKQHAYQLIIEPGRSLVGPAGLLLTQVLYLKTMRAKNFAIVDAAMNDFMRPSLYQAQHAVSLVTPDRSQQSIKTKEWDIVGPVCESGDFLARNCQLALAEGDLLAILTTGAYGFSMSSQYNSRPRATEILVDGSQAQCIRRRETVDDLMRGECLFDSGD